MGGGGGGGGGRYYLHGQGQCEGSYNRNLIVSIVSSGLLVI